MNDMESVSLNHRGNMEACLDIVSKHSIKKEKDKIGLESVAAKSHSVCEIIEDMKTHGWKLLLFFKWQSFNPANEQHMNILFSLETCFHFFQGCYPKGW